MSVIPMRADGCDGIVKGEMSCDHIVEDLMDGNVLFGI